MQKFINSIGEDNVYIIIAIIVVIIIALLIIIVIEKISDRKNQVFFNDIDKNKIKSNKETSVNETFDFPINEETKLQEKVPERTETVSNKIIPEKSKKSEPEEELTYITKQQTQEEAKKAIEEAAKKLVYEDKPDIISPTFFEKVQEEQSIISYDELLKTNVHEVINTKNEIMDEGNEPITIDEIYNREDQVEEPSVKKLLEDEESLIYNDLDVKDENEKQVNYINNRDSFKPSDVISPVFGVKREIVYQKEYNELGETINIKELEVEIKKTEEFLKELKKLKNKLD